MLLTAAGASQMKKLILWFLLLVPAAVPISAQRTPIEINLDQTPVSGCRRLALRNPWQGGSDKSVLLGCIVNGALELRIGDTSGVPDFGGQIRTVARDGNNSIVGSAINDLPANSRAFQTAVTGYCRTNNPGNSCFGLFGRADLYSSGIATNEVNSFNWSGAPSTALPPDRSFGGAARVPVALTVAAGGAYNSSIGIQVAKEGEKPQGFLTGLYVNPDAVKNYGVFIDSTADSTMSPLVVKHATANIGVQIQGVGKAAWQNAAMTYRDSAGTARFVLRQSGDVAMRAVTANAASVPTIVTCSGIGSGGNCTLASGSGDGVGTIVLKGGKAAPASGGMVGLTFSYPLGDHSSSCVLTAGPGFVPNSALFITAQNSNGVIINYINGGGTGTALRPGATYSFNYHCMGR